MRVRDICNSRVETIAESEMLASAADAMRAADVSSPAVTRDGEIVGIVTDRDLVQAVADRADLKRTAISAYMTSEIFGADGELDSSEAATLMLEKGVRHLPVLDAGEVIGMVSTRDLLLLEAWPAA
jgi:CBS domain-containing protein